MSLQVKDTISGNAATSTTLQTARSINGTSFNGSANITTASWGTARTLTIGSKGKSVDGSGNISWSLSEIGAAPSSHTHDYAASSHTHSYLPLSGGTMTGDITTSKNINFTANNTGLKQGGTLYLRSNGTSTVLSCINATMYLRPKGDSDSSVQVTIDTAGNVTAPKFTGALAGNASTATKLATTRAIKIGNKSNNFDGSAAITYTLADIGAAASGHTHTSIQEESLSGLTVSLNDYTLSAGTTHVKYYYCPTDGGGSNITGRPNDSNKTAFKLKVELIRWASTTDYITQQTYVRGAEKVMYVRYCTSGTWSSWEKVYTSGQKPSASDIGAAASSHTHNYAGSSSAGGAANSVKTNLVIKLNGGSTEGTNLFTFNGGTAKTVNITPSAIGAAASSHGTHLTIGTTATTAAAGNHTHSYLPLSGGTMTGKITSNVSTGTDMLGWTTGALRKVTDQGGTLIHCDSSLFLHAGDNGATIAAAEGAAAAYTTENMYLSADGSINIAVKTQDGYDAATKFTISTSGFSGNAATATKVNKNLAIKLNGGSTEGTNLFTFNGSAAKSVNITPASIGTVKAQKLTQSSYNSATKDSNTLYIIVG